MIAFVLACTLLGPAAPASVVAAVQGHAPAPRWTLDEVLAAIREVETGGAADGGRHATGDSGAALGPYQIHRVYWQDARVAGRYEDCADAEYSRRVVAAYWRRWCPRAVETIDAEVLARVHNGGPRGDTKRSTLAFWRKVEAALERGRV